MRFLASGFNDLAYKRRDAVVSHLKDPILQQRLKGATLGIDTFFKDDMDKKIDLASAR